MSTKVYEAYRIREGHDPFRVLWEIQRRGREGARQRLAKLYRDVLEGRSQEEHRKQQEQDKLFTAWLKEKHGDGERDHFSFLHEYYTWAHSECPPELKTSADVYAVSNEEILAAALSKKKEAPGVFEVDCWARAQYGEQLTKHEKHPWALDVAVTVRTLDGRFYLIPYCEDSCLLSGILKFMETMEELEDFFYWNNTDPPDEVTEPEWEARGDVWYHFTGGDRWAEFLTLEIVSWMGWPEVSPLIEMAGGEE